MMALRAMTVRLAEYIENSVHPAVGKQRVLLFAALVLLNSVYDGMSNKTRVAAVRAALEILDC